jgi:hypothetical protein
MPGTIKRIGPVALTTTLTTNVYNQASALIYDVITHLEVTNKTGTAATFSLWIGATGANAAGTEWFSAVSVPANSVYHWYGRKKIASTDFIVGGAGTTLALVAQMESDQNVV